MFLFRKKSLQEEVKAHSKNLAEQYREAWRASSISRNCNTFHIFFEDRSIDEFADKFDILNNSENKKYLMSFYENAKIKKSVFDCHVDSGFWNILRELNLKLIEERYMHDFHSTELIFARYHDFLEKTLPPVCDACLNRNFDIKSLNMLIKAFNIFADLTKQVSSEISRVDRKITEYLDILNEPINLLNSLEIESRHFHVSDYNESRRYELKIASFIKKIEAGKQNYEGILRNEQINAYMVKLNSVLAKLKESYEWQKAHSSFLRSFWEAYYSDNQQKIADLLIGNPTHGGSEGVRMGKGITAYAGVADLPHKSKMGEGEHTWANSIFNSPPLKTPYYANRLIKIMKTGYRPSSRKGIPIIGNESFYNIFFFASPHDQYGGNKALISWPCDDYCVFGPDKPGAERWIIKSKPIPPSKLTIYIKDPLLISYFEKAGIPYVDWTKKSRT